MSTIKQLIKAKVLQMIEVLPMGRDLYLHFASSRLGISYRGIYGDYHEADSAVSQAVAKEYDIINENKSENAEQEKTTLDDWFHDIDYPLLFWLSRLVGEDTVLLELGGSVGHFFFTSDRYLNYPQKLRWTIAELPHAVKLGRQIVAERDEQRLSYINSDDLTTAEPANVFMTAGTLQYMNTHVAEIITSLSVLPEHVLIHNLPVHRDKSFWTLQNLGVCELPYRIYSLSELNAAMSDLGYKQVATWTNPRSIEIPFHRGLNIDGYLGFYFQKN